MFGTNLARRRESVAGDRSIMNSEDKIAALRARNRHDELERINRLTGLNFEAVPESLLNRQEEWEAFTESLLGVAINTWSRDSRRA